MAKRGICSRPTCDRVEEVVGLCRPHYKRAVAIGELPPSGRVDPGKAVARMRELIAGGMSISQISHLSGVNADSLQKILRGKQRQIYARSEAQILSLEVPPPLEIELGRIDGTGTARRLQALVAFGYSQRYLSQRLGMRENNFRPVLLAMHRIRVKHARAVAELFEELQLTPGPDNKARARALAKGWPPPMAWDEDLIDDPEAETPAVTAVRKKSDWLVPYYELREMGKTQVQAAERLGIPLDTVQARLRREERKVAA